MENHKYSVEELALDDSFINYCLDTGSSDSSHWKTIIRDHPGQKHVFEEARQLVLALHGGLSSSEINRQIEKVRQQLQQRRMKEEPLQLSADPDLSTTFIVKEDGTIRRKNLRRFFLYASAAVAILIVSFLAIRLLLPDRGNDKNFSYSSIVKSKNLTEKINTSDEPMLISLPDGSKVQLFSGSSVSYESKMDSALSRDVYLNGEAFFEVTENPARPFRVFANEVVTKVLGTSFTVRSFEKDETISVTVRTGKVSVYSQNTGHKKETEDPEKTHVILLTPNQQAVYKKTEKEFEKLLLDKPAIIIPGLLQSMVYEDAPVINILEQMKAAYGIVIGYDKETLKECTITADLSGESLYRKLDLICEAIGAGYEVVNAQVYIYAGGCVK